jgi:plastocyanin
VVDGQPGPSQTVHVLGLPELALPEQLSVLAGEEMNLTPALLDETGVQPLFRWDSGDGRTTEGAAFRHSYTKPGQYTVRLRLSGGSEGPACLAAEKEIAVTVLPPPDVRLLHEPEQVFSGGARDEALFHTDLPADQGRWVCHWDFGDGGKAEGEAVSHAFQKPGTYTVTLTLTDGSGIARKPYSFSRKIKVQAHGD